MHCPVEYQALASVPPGIWLDVRGEGEDLGLSDQEGGRLRLQEEHWVWEWKQEMHFWA